MRRVGATGQFAEEPVRSAARKVRPNRRREQAWKRRLVVVVLIHSDLVLATLIWDGASVTHGIWGADRSRG